MRRVGVNMTTLGLIGSGRIGSTVARLAVDAGHDVVLSNSRGPETLADLVAELGPRARAATGAEAATAGALVLVSTPLSAYPSLPAAALVGKTVLDTGNYYPQRDGRIEEIEQGTPESVWVSRRLGRPVVKAFNNIRAQHLLEHGKPAGTPGRIALPVAGDDEAAKSTVLALVDELGFDPVDAGALAESWRQQPGTPVYGADLDADGVRAALAAATR